MDAGTADSVVETAMDVSLRNIINASREPMPAKAAWGIAQAAVFAALRLLLGGEVTPAPDSAVHQPPATGQAANCATEVVQRADDVREQTPVAATRAFHRGHCAATIIGSYTGDIQQ